VDHANGTQARESRVGEAMLRVRGFTVRVERDGEAFTASASLCDGLVTVWIENSSKRGPVGNRSAEVVGAMLLEELLLEGKR
jgi:hypothetical protein